MIKKPVIISFFNNKGGVGKSTLTANIASIFADEYKVLIIDNDPQGNLSSRFSQSRDSEIYKVYMGKHFEIKKVDFEPALKEYELNRKVKKELWILTGGRELTQAETFLLNKPAREFTLSENLKDKIAGFDFVFIDNPPSENILVYNALCLSDYVIIPFLPGRDELDGVDTLFDIIKSVNKKLHHKLEVLGILINLVTPGNIMKHFVKTIIETMQNKAVVFESYIKMSTAYRDAIALGIPVDIYLSRNNILEKEFIEDIEQIKSEILEILEG